jgi:hypothetical protein
MFKRIFLITASAILLCGLVSAEIGSLSHLYLHGKGVKDTDGDGLADRVALTIIIPDNPTAVELAMAADIAARVNLESLVQDFALVKRESEITDLESVECPVLIGGNVKWLKQAVKEGGVVLPVLGLGQGFVGVFTSKRQSGIILTAGSEDALLQTGRAFFLRWPYFWDIWGREEGATYASLERDIVGYLKTEGVALQRTIFRSVLYEFPVLKNGPGALKKLSFGAGEVKDLNVEIYFTDEDDLVRTHQAVESLRLQHRQGRKTDILSYPGCAQLSFSLRYGKIARTAMIPRLGYPKRMLTPGFKDNPRADGAGKEFDLLSLFTTKGVYGDIDRDGIIDAIDTRIIVPSAGPIRGVAPLASKLVLNTAGASFPLVYLDREIEFRKAVVAPILVGANALTLELQRIGKLVLPALENASGLIRTVPRAFNKSSALVVTAPDAIGLEKTLNYLSGTYPYLDEAKDGRPQLTDAAADLERFLKGEKGAAEAFFALNLKKTMESLKDKELESFKADLLLPKADPRFEDELKKTSAAVLKTPSLEVQSSGLKGSKRIFEKEQTFTWEVDEALAAVKAKLQTLEDTQTPVRISLGLSESPEVRDRIKKEIETQAALTLKAAKAEVEVLSAYKQGFYWILEKAIPALKGKPIVLVTIKFAEEKDDFGKPKRFYTESSRWLQELYPIDEFLSRDLGLPVESIQFEMIPAGGPTYSLTALDAKNAVLWEGTFSPRIREIPYLKLLPEWGTVKVTTGWIRVTNGNEIVQDTPLQTDLERVWSYFQEEGLAPIFSHIQKKTGGAPTFTKQPYFKQLKVEVWSSEPDYRIGLDEEIVSSLEALHDEIYFDTLDFLRGITEIDAEDTDVPEDTTRYSAPGNVFPIIHPSTEGGAPKIKITFEDWPGTAPQMTLTWKEKGRDETTKRFSFPVLKSKSVSLPALIYSGLEEKLDQLIFDLEFEREADYLTLLDLLAAYRELQDKKALTDPLSFPNLNGITLALRCKDLAKEEKIPVLPPEPGTERPGPPALRTDESIVDTTRILSPEMVEDAVSRLAKFPVLRTYIAGRSYEGRRVPVIEAFKPFGPNVSIPRLIAMKPTIYLSGRQHANEVSSTNYILKLAELLASDKPTQEYLNKINFVLHPMENPDGAALAYELQALTPFHSLHAGRYSALGLEIGTMTGSARPLLPEASVKRDLTAKWFPDISLNLHGYPSHEWVQQFSNYSPYLFREYWIPKGWFAYVRGLTLPIYGRYKEAGEEIRSYIVTEMNADPKIKDSNKKFYDRYARWASRWQPHLNFLELYDGLNLYAKRRSSTESRLTARGQITYAEETPELMDETARGAWLDFLSTQGLTYLRAHMKYLAQAKFEIVRIEEESQDRVRIQFLRGRPGTTKK